MSIKVESASAKEVVTTSDVAPETKVEKKEPASTEKSDETIDESETSEESEDQTSEEQTDDDGDDDGDEDIQAKADDKKPKRSGFKRRIDKLTGKLSAKEQEVEFWKTEAMKSQKPKATEVETTRNAAVEGKPVAESFDSHDEYVEALTDWKLDKKLNDVEMKQKQTKAKTEFESQIKMHIERVSTFAKNHDDFNELIEDIDDITMSPTVQEVILSSDDGPALMYALAKDRKEYERICKLPAIAAARELGKFEAKHVRSTESQEVKEVKTTKAPAPIRTVGTGSTATGKKTIFDPDVSQREYEKMRRAQIAKQA